MSVGRRGYGMGGQVPFLYPKESKDIEHAQTRRTVTRTNTHGSIYIAPAVLFLPDMNMDAEEDEEEEEAEAEVTPVLKRCNIYNACQVGEKNI